jgi:hypothetical protein
VLNLEATSSEADVEMALALLLDAVRELVREFRPALMPQVRALALDVGIYDRLLLSQHRLDDASDASQVAHEVRSAHDQARELARLRPLRQPDPSRRPVHPTR